MKDTDQIVNTIKNSDGVTAAMAIQELANLLGVDAVRPILLALGARSVGENFEDTDTRVCLAVAVQTFCKIGQPAVPLLSSVLRLEYTDYLNEIAVSVALAALQEIGGNEAEVAVKRYISMGRSMGL